MWRIWWASNASRWQMGFNSAFKGLIQALEVWILGTATNFPLKTRLRYSRVPFKACFTLQNYGLLLLELTTNTTALTWSTSTLTSKCILCFFTDLLSFVCCHVEASRNLTRFSFWSTSSRPASYGYLCDTLACTICTTWRKYTAFESYSYSWKYTVF
jgi:hypothetical protein